MRGSINKSDDLQRFGPNSLQTPRALREGHLPQGHLLGCGHGPDNDATSGVHSGPKFHRNASTQYNGNMARLLVVVPSFLEPSLLFFALREGAVEKALNKRGVAVVQLVPLSRSRERAGAA